jgi:predicted nucleic acid-binding protein
MSSVTALLDANVLYSAGLRDVLLRFADRRLYRPKWSDAIHEEWIRTVIANRPDLTPAILARVRETMNGHFPDALVAGFESLIEALRLPDPDDRHVLAAAIQGRADVIVTQNLRDFPPERLNGFGLEARHPDTFAVNLFTLYPGAALAAIRDHRAALRNPRRSPLEHIAALERMGLVQLASALEDYADVI